MVLKHEIQDQLHSDENYMFGQKTLYPTDASQLESRVKAVHKLNDELDIQLSVSTTIDDKLRKLYNPIPSTIASRDI